MERARANPHHTRWSTEDSGRGPTAVTHFLSEVLVRRAVGQRDVAVAVASDVRVLKVGKVCLYPRGWPLPGTMLVCSQRYCDPARPRLAPRQKEGGSGVAQSRSPSRSKRRGDAWGCKGCKQRGDTWGCKGSVCCNKWGGYASGPRPQPAAVQAKKIGRQVLARRGRLGGGTDGELEGA